jgi:hypothetical protein
MEAHEVDNRIQKSWKERVREDGVMQITETLRQREKTLVFVLWIKHRLNMLVIRQFSSQF